MKNLLLLILAILGLTSCSKDSLDLSFEPQGPEKSEIMVRVSYLAWSDQECELGCVTGNAQVVYFIADAKIDLYQGAEIENDAEVSPIIITRTDQEGSALLEDIEPSTYTIHVETILGSKSRTVTTQLNKRSNIDFSF